MAGIKFTGSAQPVKRTDVPRAAWWLVLHAARIDTALQHELWNLSFSLTLRCIAAVSRGGVSMRASLICLVLLSGLTLSIPSHAEYLLNCRLMDHASPNFKRWCLGEFGQVGSLVRRCSAQALCAIREQNFESAYSKGPAITKADSAKYSGAGVVSRTTVGSIAPGSTVSRATNAVGSLGSTAGSTLSNAAQVLSD
jgi:hypothetical protein